MNKCSFCGKDVPDGKGNFIRQTIICPEHDIGPMLDEHGNNTNYAKNWDDLSEKNKYSMGSSHILPDARFDQKPWSGAPAITELTQDQYDKFNIAKHYPLNPDGSSPTEATRCCPFNTNKQSKWAIDHKSEQNKIYPVPLNTIDQNFLNDIWKLKYGDLSQPKIYTNVELGNLGFVANNINELKVQWLNGCPGGKMKKDIGSLKNSSKGTTIKAWMDANKWGADSIIGQHNCRVFYYWKYQLKNEQTFESWLYDENCQAYTWAMDEYICKDSNKVLPNLEKNDYSIICGVWTDSKNTSNKPSDIPTIKDMSKFTCGVYSQDCNTQYTETKGPRGKNSKDYAGLYKSILPASSCGSKMQKNKPIYLQSGSTWNTWWNINQGCGPKTVQGSPTNPSPDRNGGIFHVEFLEWSDSMKDAFNKLSS